MTRKSDNIFIYLIILLTISCCCCENNEYCSLTDTKSESCKNTQHFSNKRYILYDVNPPEGFNLRRDVYVRVATFVKNLVAKEKDFKWNLVLPPWGPLHHWQSKDIVSQIQLPWGTFFDIESLQKYIPVIEMYQFVKEYPSNNGYTILDKVYILQNDPEMFKTGKFRDMNKVLDYTSTDMTYRKKKGLYYGNFWNYNNITAKSVSYIIFHGMMSGIQQNLLFHKYRSIKFDHMEIPLHDFYGSVDYWTARRSMRYNKELYRIANKFRKEYLNSNDIDDRTDRPSDWTQERGRRNALGGPYISVHMRRKDFVYSHSNFVPSIKNVATQIKNELNELQLKTVFVASDTNDDEYNELQQYLLNYTVVKYKPTNYVKNKFKDGGIAIIDQILCSYGRYFIGTKESTFTFRIQEDREIIGFPADTTFNFLCAKGKCASGGRWEIVW